jgi:hypothetical protein
MASFFDQFLGSAAAQIEPVMRELGEWVSVLQRPALAKWTPVVLSGAKCSVRHDRRPCGRQGIGKCVLCEQLVCLRHAAVGFDATVICETCLDDYAETIKGKAKDRPQDQAPPPPADDEATKRKAAFTTLGLTDDSTWEEVRQEYRDLVKKFHPDKHATKTAAQRKKAEQKMAEINAAYTYLERVMKR